MPIVYVVYIHEKCILFGTEIDNMSRPSNLAFISIESAHKYMSNRHPYTQYMLRETSINELRCMQFVKITPAE